MDLSYIAREQIVIKDVRMLYIHVAHKMAPLFTLPTGYCIQRGGAQQTDSNQRRQNAVHVANKKWSHGAFCQYTAGGTDSNQRRQNAVHVAHTKLLHRAPCQHTAGGTYSNQRRQNAEHVAHKMASRCTLPTIYSGVEQTDSNQR